MGRRGKPRGRSGADAAQRGNGYAAAPPPTGRAERRKLARKVRRRRRRSALREIPLMIVVAVGIALFLKTFLIQAFVIPSGSMEQTIRIGDRVVVDKLTPTSAPGPSAATSSSSRTRPTGSTASRPRPPPTTPPSPPR